MSFSAWYLRCFAAASVAAALMTTLPARAQVQDSTLPDVLSGTRFPLSLRFRDLDAAWRRVVVGGQTPPAAGQAPGAGEVGVYYTRGETVAVGAETYLVAYRQDPATRARPAGGAAPRRTLDTLLLLSLLNLRTSGDLHDIRPVNVQREVAARSMKPKGPGPVSGPSRAIGAGAASGSGV